MKLRQGVLGLVALVVLGIAFGVGRYFRLTPAGPTPATPSTCPNNTRCITVSAESTPGQCSVDYPVALLHYTDQGSDKVQWFSNDNQYTIDFTNIAVPPPPPTYPSLPSGYLAETPLAPPDNQVLVDISHPSRIYTVKHNTKYYYYAIKDASNNVCKVSTDDQDTGLSVKR